MGGDQAPGELLELLDLKKTGLDGRVREGIRKNRMGTFRLSSARFDGAEKPAVHAKLIKHDFYFGSNIFMLDLLENEEKNQAYREAFSSLFNLAVVPFYWRDDEPRRGQTRYGASSPALPRRPVGHHVLDFCREYGITPKAHNFFYHHPNVGMPEWLRGCREEIAALLPERMEAIAKEYGGSIPLWDVVNEALTRGYEDVMPQNYVGDAFKKADQLFPDCRLFANEDTRASWLDFWWDTSPYYLYLKNLLFQGARLDGIGMQYHLFYPREQLGQYKNKLFNARYLLDLLDQYALLDRDIHVSEVTLSAYGTGAEEEAVQAVMAENLYKIWFSSPKVKAVIWWNLVDGYAYERPGWNENAYHGGLIDHDFRRKPAYLALERLIKKEWSTEVEILPRNGLASFEGYFGAYEIQLKWPNGTTEKRNVLINETGTYDL